MLTNFHNKFPILKSLNSSFCENSSRLMDAETNLDEKFVIKTGNQIINKIKKLKIFYLIFYLKFTVKFLTK
jgi:hypothetical protein